MSEKQASLMGDRSACFRQAAWQLEDAIAEKVCEQYPSEPEARQTFFRVLNAQKWYVRGLMLMIMLTIFETPTWCDTNSTWEWGDPQHRCLVYGEKTAAYPEGKPIHVMLSGITYWPPGYSLMFEVLILGILANKWLLERKLQVTYFVPLQPKEGEVSKSGGGEEGSKEDEEGKEENMEYFQLGKNSFCILVIVLELIDCVIFFFFRPQFRFAFLCRTTLLCLQPSVIKLAACIRKILVEVGTVAVFFVGFLFFFAWVSVTIFNGDDKPPEHFKDFGRAFYGLFVAGVCDEFTDVLLESYTKYRGIGILWFIFLVVVHLLFLSLVLDTLCAGYMKSEEEEKKQVNAEKAEGVLRAFDLMSDESGEKKQKVSKESFMLFLEEYNASPGVNSVEKQYAELAFREVDRDRDGYIDENEFTELCALTQYEMWRTRKDSKIKELSPTFWDLWWVRAIRESVMAPDGLFESIMTIVLTVNFVLVVIETTYDLNKWDEPAWTEWLEFVFSFIYLGECAFKICVTGWPFYWSSTSNIFDFGTTLLLLSTSIFESFLGSFSTYANILRLFRLLRVVKQLKGLDRVQFMVSTVVKLVFKAQDMLILLSVVIFGFTVVGVQLFGGLLYEENEKLEGTSYHEEKEFVLNFNDFLMAFGLWFVFLLCEYKPSFAAAIHRTSSIPKAWLMFTLFWCIAVCITFELVKAFTIEVYMDLKKKWDNKKKNGEETPDVINCIYQHFEREGSRFWYRCLAVDEDEYDEVVEEVGKTIEKREKEAAGEGEHGHHGDGKGEH